MGKYYLSCFLLLIILLFSLPAAAFNRDSRCQIIRDAIEFAPVALQKYLVKNFDSIHQGVHYIDLAGQKQVDPYQAEEIYQSLVNSLSAGKLNSFNTCQRFGILAGYLAETVSPSQYRGLRDLIPGYVPFDGYQQPGNIHDSISRIVRNYRNPYLDRTERKVTDYLYIIAVNEVIDHWRAAWEAGGQQSGGELTAGMAIQRRRKADLLRGVNVRLPG